MNRQQITLTARTLRALLDPVLPCASSDIGLPVLNGVLVETRGKWLTATATDRLRLGLKRVAEPEGDEWPQFRGVISARSIRNIFATFKPLRGIDPELLMTIEGDRLTVEATGGLVDVAGASATYYLVDGEFPKVDRLLSKALKAEPQPLDSGFNFKLISAFGAADRNGVGLRVRCGGPKDPLLVIGDDFLGLLMPRAVHAIADDGWDDVLTNAASKEKAA